MERLRINIKHGSYQKTKLGNKGNIKYRETKKNSKLVINWTEP
jgi:hypothetical protein